MSKVIMLILPVCLVTTGVAAGELTGAASYRERISLPPEAQFSAILYDISNSDQVEIGRYEAMGDSGPPYLFTITYDHSIISNEGRYALRAEVIWPDRPYFQAGQVFEDFPKNPDPAIQLTMVWPTVETSDTETGSLQTVPALIAHGLTLPANFRGVTEGGEVQTDWHLSHWPDQFFQLVHISHDATYTPEII